MNTGKWEFAVLDDTDTTVAVVDDVEDAFDVAEDVAGGPQHVQTDDPLSLVGTQVRGNPYVELPPAFADLEDLVKLKSKKAASGAVAFRVSGLEQVSGQEIMELTDGLTDPSEVFERLEPYFEHLEGANWKDAASLVQSMIGGNEKVNKRAEGVQGTIKGLTLVPFWRNLQDELVEEAPLDKKVLQDIEADFDIEKPPRVGNWCAGSSWACRRACLIGTGNNYQPRSFKTKFAKAAALKGDPVAFMSALAMNIEQFDKAQRRNGKTAFVRLNMLTDIPWEIVCPDLFTLFPDVQFYDYTKVDVSTRDIPSNYDLTFSFSGTNEGACRKALEAGHRVAVVMVSANPKRTPYRKDKRISFGEVVEAIGTEMENPFGARIGSVPIVDGDVTDFRAVDPAPSIVVLSYKGPKGVPPDTERKIRFESKFAVPVDTRDNPRGKTTVIPVKRMGSVYLTAHTPLQQPFMPSET